MPKDRSSSSTYSTFGVQDLKTVKVSPLFIQPCTVSLTEPVNAMRSPVLSSMMPVFSWKMAVPATGTRVTGWQGTATLTSSMPRATSQARSSSASRSLGDTMSGRLKSALPATTSIMDMPRSIASTSASSRVQPTSSRILPWLRARCSMPRAASARLPARK